MVSLRLIDKKGSADEDIPGPGHHNSAVGGLAPDDGGRLAVDENHGHSLDDGVGAAGLALRLVPHAGGGFPLDEDIR